MPSLIASTAYGSFVWSEMQIPLLFIPIGTTTERIIIELYDSGNHISTLAYPSNEPVLIDLQPIAKSLPKPTRPELRIGGALVQIPQNQNGVFDLSVYYRLSSEAAPGTLLPRKVLKGGWHNMAQHEAHSPNYYTTFDPFKFYPTRIAEQLRWLSFVPSGRRMDASEHGWLSYVQEVPALISQRVVYYVKYINNTWGTIIRTFPAGVSLDKTTWHIPVGIAQVRLDPDNIGVESVDIVVQGGMFGEATLAQYKVFYDYKPVYNWIDVHYRNSLGGWDFFRFTGAIEHNSAVERKDFEVRSIIPLGTISNFKGTNNWYESQLKTGWKANTGYISQQHMAALNDLLLSKDVCLFFEGKFLPIKCTTKQLKWNDSRNGLWNEVFEFETAGSFETLPLQVTQFFAQYPEAR